MTDLPNHFTLDCHFPSPHIKRFANAELPMFTFQAFIYDGSPTFENELSAFLGDPTPTPSLLILPFTPELLGTRVVFTASDGLRYIKTAYGDLDGDLCLFLRLAASDEEEHTNAEIREADIIFLPDIAPIFHPTTYLVPP